MTTTNPFALPKSQQGSRFDPFNPVLAVKPNKLEDCELWESETFAGYLDDQSGDNR